LSLAKVEPYDFIANYTGWVAEPDRKAFTRKPESFAAYRLHGDNLHYDVCILNPIGPQSVKSVSLDGNHVEWESRWEGNMLVFDPPDGHDIQHGFFWGYDARLQQGIAMSSTVWGRKEIERFAMNYRVSVVKPEMAN
jgi:hypothetical protein